MDTDDLTEMAYQTIILADAATDVLKCELGILSGKCQTEDEYLVRVQEYLAALSKEPEEFLDYWGLLDKTDVQSFIENSVICGGTLRPPCRPLTRNAASPYFNRGTGILPVEPFEGKMPVLQSSGAFDGKINLSGQRYATRSVHRQSPYHPAERRGADAPDS